MGTYTAWSEKEEGPAKPVQWGRALACPGCK
jgi:hypothetical protein